MNPNVNNFNQVEKEMFYFAYGSNLNIEQMSLRCPDATPISAAILRDYKLTERKYADIDKSPGDAVSGGLWSITAADLRKLDRYEGYPSFYIRYLAPVELPDGKTVEAIVYEMCPEAKADRNGHLYNSDYRQLCADGAAYFGIQSQF